MQYVQRDVYELTPVYSTTHRLKFVAASFTKYPCGSTCSKYAITNDVMHSATRQRHAKHTHMATSHGPDNC